MRVLRDRGPRRAVTLLLAFVLMLAAMLAGAVSAVADDDPKSEKPNAKPAQLREEQGTLPKSGELPVPGAEELLRSRPFDWIILKTQEVLVVEPVAMRPDLISRLPIRHDLAAQSYARLLKLKPVKEAELNSLRQYFKNADRTEEFNDREAQLKQELDARRMPPTRTEPPNRTGAQFSRPSQSALRSLRRIEMIL